MGGERHPGWPAFYHAGDGTWTMQDPMCYVLKSQKFVSSDRERDEYLVRAVPAGGVLRIIRGEGRWKQVEVLENGKVVATGWIDAHFVKKADRQDEPKPE